MLRPQTAAASQLFTWKRRPARIYVKVFMGNSTCHRGPGSAGSYPIPEAWTQAAGPWDLQFCKVLRVKGTLVSSWPGFLCFSWTRCGSSQEQLACGLSHGSLPSQEARVGSVPLSNGRDSSGSWPRRTHWCLRHLQRARKSSWRKDVSERAGQGWRGRGSMLNPNSPPSRVRTGSSAGARAPHGLRLRPQV